MFYSNSFRKTIITPDHHYTSICCRSLYKCINNIWINQISIIVCVINVCLVSMRLVFYFSFSIFFSLNFSFKWSNQYILLFIWWCGLLCGKICEWRVIERIKYFILNFWFKTDFLTIQDSTLWSTMLSWNWAITKMALESSLRFHTNSSVILTPYLTIAFIFTLIILHMNQMCKSSLCGGSHGFCLFAMIVVCILIQYQSAYLAIPNGKWAQKRFHNSVQNIMGRCYY